MLDAIVEELVDEMKVEWIEEGTNEERINIAKELIADGTFSLEKIAKISKLPLEEVKKLIAENKA